MMKKYTLKQILTTNQAWWHFYQKNKHALRPAILIAIVKLLSCRNTVRGYLEYRCENIQCPPIKRVIFTCKSKACSSCGKKATETWIEKQRLILPRTSWQHITFTMPSELWDFFWLNRHLLNAIAKLAADCIKNIASKKNVTPGIFIAIHTFGRDLKRNVHIHLSTTTGGLSDDNSSWKNLFFDQKTLMRLWRYAIITLFRQAYAQKNLIIPKVIQQQLTPLFTFNHFLDRLYKKPWIVHCTKPSIDHKHTVHYLGRYTKRPPIAESKLKHYDGNQVVFNYLNHKTNSYQQFTLSVEEFIGRFVQHIPDVGFRMIRYYGFLAHRVRGILLPIVYQLLGQKEPSNPPAPTFAQLIIKNFGFNPLTCILCGQQLILSLIRYGQTSTLDLLNAHRELALLKKI